MKYILRMTMKNIAIILVGLILACWSWIYLPKVVHADEITPLEINSATQRANNKELKFDATIDDNRESGIYFKSNNPNEMTFDDDLIILIDDYDFKSQTDIENFVNRNNVAKPILLHWNENHKIDRIEYNQISPYPFADVKGTCNGSDACLLSGSGNTGFFGQACYLGNWPNISRIANYTWKSSFYTASGDVLTMNPGDSASGPSLTITTANIGV